MADADGRTLAASLTEDLGLVDVPPDPEHENCRQKADRKQDAPGDRLRQPGIKCGVDQSRRPPAYRPARLHNADTATPVFVPDHLTHQDSAGRPLTAKAEAMKRTQYE